MRKRAIPQVLPADLHRHPAVGAWMGLSRARPRPREVLPLKQTAKSAVYRLAGVGPQGSSVIAKWCKRHVALHEYHIYENILPNLPVSSLRCYGYVDEHDTDYGWLFLEDAGDEAYCPSHEHHRFLATQWLAAMHATAPQIAATASLPPRGPGWYLEQLRSAREVLLRGLAHSPFDPDAAAILRTVVKQLDDLEKRWDELETLSQTNSPTMVHGDFVSKNVAVRHDQQTKFLLPFDWGTAGWGIPAADLAAVDIILYRRITMTHQSSCDLDDMIRLARIGRIFRFVVAISWASSSTVHQRTERRIAEMRRYSAALSSLDLQL